MSWISICQAGRTGTQIAEDIYKINAETPIMVMLGTFDSVEKKSWDRTKICEKIVKPFNSKEFIEKCSRLLKKDEGRDNHEHWSIGGVDKYQGPQEKDEEIWDDGSNFLLEGNSLHREVQDWGVGVPEIIGSDEINTAMESLPAVISGESGTADDDLSKKFSQGGMDEENLENDLSVNIDANEFWSIDGGVDTDAGLAEIKDADSEGESRHFGKNLTEEEIKNALKPVLEEIVKKYCSRKIEEVAWEVIPDLAENLIRSEIKEISHRLTGG